MLHTTATYQEIITQPDAWLQAADLVVDQTLPLQQLWQDGRFSEVIFTGCGSTYYVSVAAAALFQELVGCAARAVPAGELLLYPASSYARESRPLLVAISRSARTTETLMVVDHFQAAGRGEAITITNYPDQPIASRGALN